jgi:hypothetical protein
MKPVYIPMVAASPSTRPMHRRWAHERRARRTRVDHQCQEVVELVTDYLQGVLDSDTAAEVEAHIGLCDGCNIYVQQVL